MAGALPHLAGANPDIFDLENGKYTMSYRRAYILGLFLPDMAKDGLIERIAEKRNITPEQYFDMLFEGCEEEDMMTWEEFQEFRKTNHFNPSKDDPTKQDPVDPKLDEFFEKVDKEKRQKAVWKGILSHLCMDKAFYYKEYCTRRSRAIKDAEEARIEVWKQRMER